jgi:hypothetical protein
LDFFGPCGCAGAHHVRLAIVVRALFPAPSQHQNLRLPGTEQKRSGAFIRTTPLSSALTVITNQPKMMISALLLFAAFVAPLIASSQSVEEPITTVRFHDWVESHAKFYAGDEGLSRIETWLANDGKY